MVDDAGTTNTGGRSPRRRRALGVTVLVAVLALGAVTVRVAVTPATAPPAGNRAAANAPAGFRAGALVLSSDGLFPLDTTTDRFGRPIAVGSDPSALAVTPDGGTAIVADVDGTVIPVDVADRRAGRPVQAGCNPVLVAVAPGGRIAFVLSYGPPPTATAASPTGSGDTTTSSSVVTTVPATTIPPGGGSPPCPYSATSGVVSEIEVGADRARPPLAIDGAPIAIAFTPDGRTAYVECADDRIVPVDVATDTAERPIPLALSTAHEPESIAMSADGRTLYVAGAVDTVVPIDTATDEPGAAINVGTEPMALAISAGGKALVVVDGAMGQVSIVDTATGRSARGVPTGVAPTFVTVSPRGSLAYVGGGLWVPAQDPGTVVGTGTGAVNQALAENGVAVVDVATRERVGSISVGGGYAPVSAIALTGDGRSGFALAAGSLYPVDTAKRTAGPALPIPGGIRGVAILP